MENDVTSTAVTGGEVSGGEESAAASAGDTLLTRETPESSPAEGTGKGEQAQDAEAKPEGGKDADAVPDTPEGYVLKYAAGVQVDRELETSFRTLAHQMGLSSGKAQKLVDMYAARMDQAGKQAQEAQATALLEAKQGWEKEITSRPGFDRELEDARKTLKEFGSEELTKLMDESLLGSHPVFFDFMAKVGRALAEPESRKAGHNPAYEKPLAERLWPNMR